MADADEAAGFDVPYRPLGGLRFLLASLVVAQHAAPLLPDQAVLAIRPLEIGNMAVYCFFIVSGFVIAEAAGAFYKTRPLAFLSNRILRIYPTYLAALVISALVIALAFGHLLPGPNESPFTSDRFAPSTVLINLLAPLPVWKTLQAHTQVPEILEQVWALRVEFTFYLVLAGCIAVSTITRFALFEFLTAIGVLVLTGTSLLPDRFAGTVLTDAPYFVFGVAYYAVVAGIRERWFPASFCVAALAFIVAQLLSQPLVFGLADFARDPRGELILLMGLTTLFLLLARRELRSRGTAYATDRWLGDLTYPLYLLHWCVLIAARNWFPGQSWATATAAFGVACLLSWLAILAIERPVGRLRARLRHRRSPDFKVAATIQNAVI